MMNTVKKILTICFICFFGGLAAGYGQTIVKNEGVLNGLNSIPKESVYIHFNSQLLFAGESLYYKMYCIDKITKKPSTLSKIGYVELVGENGQIVFKQKIRLTAGLGQGDFFIPTNVPSGNYKLIGYTRWMQNEGLPYFFQGDIGIINPYLENQEPILPKAIEQSDTTRITQAFLGLPKIKQHKALSLAVDAKTYRTRSKVSVTFKCLAGIPEYGNYSVSVRKINPISYRQQLLSEDFSIGGMQRKKNEQMAAGQPIYLPELRGELISGKVVSKDNNRQQIEKTVAISIPGTRFVYQVAHTNEEGIFYFNLDEHYDTDQSVFQVLGEDRAAYRVVVDKNISPDYKNMEFSKLAITAEMKHWILERSIHNQIQNAYAAAKRDSLSSANTRLPFYRDFVESYDLDDYTRFPTVRETMVEIVDHVWFKKNKSGKYVFQVRGYDPFIDTGLLPLVLVDGLMEQDHDYLAQYSAKKIKTVRFAREKYKIGAQVFQGIVALETIDGGYNSYEKGDFISEVELFKPLPAKHYFNPIYAEDGDKMKRIPDFREQLLWLPDLKIDSKEKKIDFYTSDTIGEYEIHVEGFSDKGTPISITETFTVN